MALSHLLARGVRLQAPEAVAIAQDLIGRGAGIPTLENVELSGDGTAFCLRTDGIPSVSDVANLLEILLPPGTPRVPAPLRYAIARGRLAVEAPPFESLEAFSRALQRFEAGERSEVIRGLLKRVSSEARPAPAPQPIAADAIQVAPRERPLGLAAAAAVVASFALGFGLIEIIDEPPAPPAISRVESVARDSAAPEPAPAVAAPSATPAEEERAVATSGRKVERVRLEAAMDGPAFSPAFGSGGTAIFFHTGGSRAARSAISVATSHNWPSGDLGVMTVVDDGSRNYHARPSPDGRFIAFDSDREGERAVYVADRDGSHVRRVSGDGYAAAPTWSPDGKRLAYIRAEADRPAVWNLWVQPVDGREPARLTNYPSGQTWTASWFPDNRRVAYTHEDKVIVQDLTTGEQKAFDSPVKGRAVRTPAVSPDGSAIIFQVFRRGAWLLDLADGSMRRVLEDPTAEEFAWAPDGRRVAFHSRRDGQWGIYLLSRG